MPLPSLGVSHHNISTYTRVHKLMAGLPDAVSIVSRLDQRRVACGLPAIDPVQAVSCVNENQRTRRAAGLSVSRENETDAHGAETRRTYVDTPDRHLNFECWHYF